MCVSVCHSEIRGEVGQIVPLSDKLLLCAEKRRLILPPNYTRFFAWGYMDQSSRIAMLEQEKVRSRESEDRWGRELVSKFLLVSKMVINFLRTKFRLMVVDFCKEKCCNI